MVKILFKFGAGLAGALLTGTFFCLFGSVAQTEFPNTSFGGDMAGGLFGILLGMPIGSLGGFYVIDKALYKSLTHNAFGLVLGFIGGFGFGGFGSLMLLDSMGGKTVFLVPLLVALFSFGGYQYGLFRRSRAQVKTVEDGSK